MKRLHRSCTLLTASMAMLIFSACTKKKPGAPSDTAQLNGQPLSSQRSEFGILTIDAELRDDGLVVRIGNVPSGSHLECTLDQKPLSPCNDGGLYARPSPGDHRISATAIRDGNITALGESAVFAVLPGAIGGAISGGDSALSLSLDDANFSSGANVALSKDFTVRFKLTSKPPCDKPQIKCNYDSQTSAFWTLCDGGGTSFSVGKDQLALGLQFLSVQASCSDKSGPILSLFWYGVPDGYQPLMLREVGDAQDRHTVDLVKQDDCADGLPRQYECAAAATDAFTPCPENSNVVDRPAKGYRMRLVCGATAPGPALTFGG